MRGPDCVKTGRKRRIPIRSFLTGPDSMCLSAIWGWIRLYSTVWKTASWLPAAKFCFRQVRVPAIWPDIRQDNGCT
ncbi:hypothetical protein D3C87_1704720 [compost metagenome]